MTQPIKWKSTTDLKDYFIEWGSEVIAFNTLSGETHEFNVLALDALIILQTPLTLFQLEEKIALSYKLAQSSDLNLQLQKLIYQFDDLGLVEIVDA